MCVPRTPAARAACGAVAAVTAPAPFEVQYCTVHISGAVRGAGTPSRLRRHRVHPVATHRSARPAHRIGCCEELRRKLKCGAGVRASVRIGGGCSSDAGANA